jgi:hypothetical protein
MLVSCSAYSSNLKMEATSSSETSIDFQRTTQRYIPKIKLFCFWQFWKLCASIQGMINSKCNNRNRLPYLEPDVIKKVYEIWNARSFPNKAPVTGRANLFCYTSNLEGGLNGSLVIPPLIFPLCENTLIKYLKMKSMNIICIEWSNC